MFYKGKQLDIKKHLGAFSLLFFGLGNIIGPQIFVMLSGLYFLSADYGLFSLLVCAAIAMLVSSVFAEVATSMPIVGPIINAVNDAYGGFASFVVGWSQFLGNLTFAAFAALAFGTIWGKPMLFAYVLLLGVTVLQFFDMSSIDALQIIFVVPLFLFFGYLLFGHSSDLITGLTTLQLNFEINNIFKVFYGVSFFFLAFTGYEDLATYAAEVKNLKSIPRVMVAIVSIIALLFIAFYALVLANPLQTDPMAFFTSSLFGTHASVVLAIMGSLAILSSVIPSMTSSARIAMSMAEKGFLPKILNKTSKGIPLYATLFSSAIVAILMLIGMNDFFIYLTNFLYFFMVLVVTLAAMKLRKKRSKLERPFTMPLYPMTPILVILLMIGLMFFLDLASLALGLLWIFFGFILYMLKVIGKKRIHIAIIGALFYIGVLIGIFSFVIPVMFPWYASYAQWILTIAASMMSIAALMYVFYRFKT